MSRGVNRVMLIGNVGKDPETRYTANGKPVTKISLATSRAWKDKESGEDRQDTQWHSVVFFDRQAEIAGEYIKKGIRVFVEGEIRYRKVAGEAGQPDRYYTDIVARDFLLLGGAQHTGGSTRTGFRDRPREEDKQDDDIPF